jgi:hypothetical protein
MKGGRVARVVCGRIETGFVQSRDIIFSLGEVPEWLNGTVSKTVMAFLAIVGSNPTLSARSFHRFALIP